MFSTSKEVTFQDATVKASLSGVDVSCGDLQLKGMNFLDFVTLVYPSIKAAAVAKAAEKGKSNG